MAVQRSIVGWTHHESLPVLPIDATLLDMTMQGLRRWTIPENLRRPLSLSLLVAGGLALFVLFLAAGGTPESAPQPTPSRPFLSTLKLPQEMQFAGQPVPLDNWQVRERKENILRTGSRFHNRTSK